MKRWIPHILSLVVLILLSVSNAAFAQEAGMSDVEVTIDNSASVNAETSTSIYSPGENVRFIPKSAAGEKKKDSIVLQIHDFPMQQATMRPPGDDAEGQGGDKSKDESILTFNFLYYIIQKYKLQDIID